MVVEEPRSSLPTSPKVKTIMGNDQEENGRLDETTRLDSSTDPSLASPCEHVGQIKDLDPSSEGCDECLQLGDTWVNLRMCLSCGNVGCCNSSKNKHASKHYQATSHPIVQSLGSFDDWMWCYADEQYVTTGES